MAIGDGMGPTGSKPPIWYNVDWDAFPYVFKQTNEWHNRRKVWPSLWSLQFSILRENYKIIFCLMCNSPWTTHKATLFRNQVTKPKNWGSLWKSKMALRNAICKFKICQSWMFQVIVWKAEHFATSGSLQTNHNSATFLDLSKHGVAPSRSIIMFPAAKTEHWRMPPSFGQAQYCLALSETDWQWGIPVPWHSPKKNVTESGENDDEPWDLSAFSPPFSPQFSELCLLIFLPRPLIWPLRCQLCPRPSSTTKPDGPGGTGAQHHKVVPQVVS